jgi:SAM-dependent methyltransferase
MTRAQGQRLLDVGCNWGRWTIAANRLGYQAVGIDPNLDAALAAQRVAAQLGCSAAFVVGDARALPFVDGAFSSVFSYSVLQHLSKPDARRSIEQVGRVLCQGGASLVQMPNKYGIRSLQHQWRLRGGPVESFGVRYWSPRELLDAFETGVGPSRLTVDAFLGLGIQPDDLDLLTPRFKFVVRASEWLRRVSVAPMLDRLLNIADSLYVHSNRRAAQNARLPS